MRTFQRENPAGSVHRSAWRSTICCNLVPLASMSSQGERLGRSRASHPASGSGPKKAPHFGGKAEGRLGAERLFDVGDPCFGGVRNAEAGARVDGARNDVGPFFARVERLGDAGHQAPLVDCGTSRKAARDYGVEAVLRL